MLAMAGLNTRGGAEMAAWAANDSVKTATIAGRPAPQSVIDEVIWVVGDEPILKSEVEITRLQSEAEGIKWDGDPDCQIPEQIAVQKLFLHQAALDSIEVTESEINQAVDQQINYWLSLPTIDGSRERLEQYQRKTISQMRQDMHDDFRDRQLVQKEQQELVKDIEVSPAEVRAYFKDMPTDSLPEIPTTVEVQILTKNPIIEQEEINRVKNQLREFTERVTKKRDFLCHAGPPLFRGQGYGTPRWRTGLHGAWSARPSLCQRSLQPHRPQQDFEDRGDGVWLSYHPAHRPSGRQGERPPYSAAPAGLRGFADGSRGTSGQYRRRHPCRKV